MLTASSSRASVSAPAGLLASEVLAGWNPPDATKAFTGREWDPEIGLYYYRARYYDPKLGRFVSQDPIGFAGGVNFYAYVLNRPTILRDAYGLAPGLNDPVSSFIDWVVDWASDFYEDYRSRRSQGHAQYPDRYPWDEENSYMRHCTISCEAAQQHGTGATRVMGILNECQGFIVHDIPRLPQRLANREEWAMDVMDLVSNETGLSCTKSSNACDPCCRQQAPSHIH